MGLLTVDVRRMQSVSCTCDVGPRASDRFQYFGLELAGWLEGLLTLNAPGQVGWQHGPEPCQLGDATFPSCHSRQELSEHGPTPCIYTWPVLHTAANLQVLFFLSLLLLSTTLNHACCIYITTLVPILSLLKFNFLEEKKWFTNKISPPYLTRLRCWTRCSALFPGSSWRGVDICALRPEKACLLHEHTGTFQTIETIRHRCNLEHPGSMLKELKPSEKTQTWHASVDNILGFITDHIAVKSSRSVVNNFRPCPPKPSARLKSSPELKASSNRTPSPMQQQLLELSHRHIYARRA